MYPPSLTFAGQKHKPGGAEVRP